ncbi:MAG: hypothetical protein RLZZ450_5861, partial [Pseudomonadota bacterium]
MLLAGCYPQIPEGVFRCQVGSECPPGQRCSAGYCRAACAVEEVEVERACYARSVDLDGGLNAGMEQKPDSGVAARERDAAAVDTAAPA